jgi:hypothetical protein
MEAVVQNGYVPGAIMMDKAITEMRAHVEFEKFICRMLIDNDDTRQMKQNTEELPDSIHRFIYNNSEVDKLTMRGKNELIGKTAYVPTPSGDLNVN